MMIGKILTSEGEKDIWSVEKTITEVENPLNRLQQNVYGPWEDRKYFFEAIVNYLLSQQIDEAFKAGNQLSEKDKQTFRDLIKSLKFPESKFRDASPKIAKKLNAWLGFDLFKETDFLPPKDLRKRTENKNEGVALADDLDDPYMWSVSRFIDEIYIHKVRQVISNNK